jgi:hypothetical protein
MRTSTLILLVFLLLWTGFCPLSRAQSVIPDSACYPETIRWNTKEQVFKDTLVRFRNAIENQKDRRVLCSDAPRDPDIEQALWKSPYVTQYYKYQVRLGKFSFLSYHDDPQGYVVASLYLCDWYSKEAVESIRFKLENKKITGINTLPCCQNTFVSIEEFEHSKGTVAP